MRFTPTAPNKTPHLAEYVALPVSHLQEEAVHRLNEEEDEDGREAVLGQQPDNGREVEEEKVDHQGGDEHGRRHERQAQPRKQKVFLV